MRLDNERPSANVEDRRGEGSIGRSGGFGRQGGFGFPGGGSGRGINIPIGAGRGGLSLKTIVLLGVVYFALKFIFGIDLVDVMNGGGVQQPSGHIPPEVTIPSVPVGKQAT